MKNSIKTAVLGLAALVSGFSACNDADYDTLGVHAFVSESASNKSTKVTITEPVSYTHLTLPTNSRV